MKKRIAIIGANDQQNPLILKAREMGFETHVFAWQTGDEAGERTADFFYPISAGNKEEILAVCRQKQVSAVVTIGSDIAAQSASYVCQQMGLPSNTYAATVCASNKLLSRTIFQKCGIPQPDFVEIGDQLPLEAIQELGYPLVIKPSDRSGGRGLSVVQNRGQLISAINQARELSFERKAIAERFIQGQLYSCECISFGGTHRLLGFTRRGVLMLNGTIREHTHKMPANLSASVSAQMEVLVPQILDALGLRNGASCVEFIVSADKRISIIEVTPTMYGDFIGTHLIPGATGYDYLKMVIDIACGKAPDLTAGSSGDLVRVRFLYSAEDWPACCKPDGTVLEQHFPSDLQYLPDAPDGSRYGYCIWSKPPKPFGGCAPRELVRGEELFFGDDVLRFNSEYTAFWYALKQIGADRVHIPHYSAPHWEKTARDMGMDVVFYHIDETFSPIDLSPGESDAVLIADCFGQCGGIIKALSLQHKNLIADHSTAFFAPQVGAKTVYHIYSARKFFAVPDGAYLVRSGLRELPEIPLEQDVSYRRMTAHMKALELGEEAAYKEQQANEQALLETRKTMSALTERLLSAEDYDTHRHRREENFGVLHNALNEFQLLPLNTGDGAVPQFYPLLVDRDIRDILVSNKIFVPLMWRKLLKPAFAGTFEQKLAQRLLCLPIDPRYSAKDMEYLAQIVTSLLD